MLSRKIAVALAASLLATAAGAQNLPVFDLERLTLDPAAHGLLVVGDGEVGPRGTGRVSFALHYERQPLVLTAAGLERGHGAGAGAPFASLVADRLTVHAGLAYAVTGWLELDLRVPFVPWQASDTTRLASRGVGVPLESGLGTPQAGLKLGLLSQERGAPLNLAFATGVLVDWGAREVIAGNEQIHFTPRLEVGRRFAGVVVGAQVGGLLRTEPARMPVVGGAPEDLHSELQAGLALSTAGRPVRFEVSGRGSWNWDDLGDSYEVLGGVRWNAGPVELFALGGPGFGEAPGTPRYRGLVGLAFDISPPAPPPAPGPVAEPEPEPAPPPPPPPPDPCAEGQAHEPEQCPELDDDADGVVNAVDACPLVKGVAEAAGCPDPDGDGDGVPDRLDRCPEEAGAAEYEGCAPPASAELSGDGKEIAIREIIHFDPGKTAIQPRSYALLDDVAAVLKAHPEVRRLAVEGHTDSTGRKRSNQALSEGRARAVRDYLLGKGIEAERVEARGLGQSRPVADDRTAAGREKNRRVEFVVE